MVTTISEIKMVASSRIGKRPLSVAASICAPRPMVCSVRSWHAGVLGDDRGVPGAARGRDHAGDEVGKDAGKNELGPALPAREVVERGNLAQVGGDGHGSGDHVEQDVPLRAQQHQRNGADAESAADLHQADEQDGKERRGRNRGQNLRDGLNDARKPGIEADGDADRDGPRSGDEQRGVDAQECGAGAFEQQPQVGPGDGPAA